MYGVNRVVGGWKLPVNPGHELAFTVARTMLEQRQIMEIVKSCPQHFKHDGLSAEFGCGYGRMLMTWHLAIGGGGIVHGVERDKELATIAQSIYGYCVSNPESLQHTNLATGVIDNAFAWTCLQHIPPTEVKLVCLEINRVVKPCGTVLIAEETHGDNKDVWGRSGMDYQDLLGMTWIRSWARIVEGGHPSGEIHLFRKGNVNGSTSI